MKFLPFIAKILFQSCKSKLFVNQLTYFLRSLCTADNAIIAGDQQVRDLHTLNIKLTMLYSLKDGSIKTEVTKLPTAKPANASESNLEGFYYFN